MILVDVRVDAGFADELVVFSESPWDPRAWGPVGAELAAGLGDAGIVDGGRGAGDEGR